MRWAEVADQMRALPSLTFRNFPVASLPAPESEGAIKSTGWPRGQSADYRWPPEHDCRGLHVERFDDRWEAHFDHVHPDCSLWQHLLQDSPVALFLAGLAAAWFFL